MITNAEADARGYIRNENYISGSSFPEQFIFRSLLQIFPRTKNRYIESLEKLEFDIVVPELNMRIEYSGEHWHSSESKIKRDKLKRDYCKNNNMVYVEIIDKNEASKFIRKIDGKHIVYIIHTGTSLPKKVSIFIGVIKDLLNNFNIINNHIDYMRAVYEALLFSTKYMYKIIRDDENRLIGIKYIENRYAYFNYYYKGSITNGR